ncbi:hypothetical protein C8R45DRAFT_1164756 [Mycena sanguinolenta]|nr:hypothetical protein C8R45DRAFT_1164756 [Mycena sanguinolenta]
MKDHLPRSQDRAMRRRWTLSSRRPHSARSMQPMSEMLSSLPTLPFTHLPRLQDGVRHPDLRHHPGSKPRLRRCLLDATLSGLLPAIPAVEFDPVSRRVDRARVGWSVIDVPDVEEDAHSAAPVGRVVLHSCGQALMKDLPKIPYRAMRRRWTLSSRRPHSARSMQPMSEMLFSLVGYQLFLSQSLSTFDSELQSVEMGCAPTRNNDNDKHDTDPEHAGDQSQLNSSEDASTEHVDPASTAETLGVYASPSYVAAPRISRVRGSSSPMFPSASTSASEAPSPGFGMGGWVLESRRDSREKERECGERARDEFTLHVSSYYLSSPAPGSHLVIFPPLSTAYDLHRSYYIDPAPPPSSACRRLRPRRAEWAVSSLVTESGYAPVSMPRDARVWGWAGWDECGGEGRRRGIRGLRLSRRRSGIVRRAGYDGDGEGEGDRRIVHPARADLVPPFEPLRLAVFSPHPDERTTTLWESTIVSEFQARIAVYSSPPTHIYGPFYHHAIFIAYPLSLDGLSYS